MQKKKKKNTTLAVLNLLFVGCEKKNGELFAIYCCMLYS